MNIKEFKERKNVHQLHFEDLVLLGEDGINELNDKIDRFIARIGGDKSGSNLTTKIDGCLAPDTIVATTEGDFPFSKIIKDYTEGKSYYGYGFNGNNVEIVKLELPRVVNGNKDWCSIEFDNGGYITATVDHPIWVDGKYIEAGKLKVHTKIDGIEQF